ncbi:MAG TPA: hypothetical protein PLV89_12850, partial [Treponemataceae bacterium]|nr:hypothetical protein [Treponemataceae bacterium]
ENDVNKITSAISTTFSAMTVHFASNFVEQMMTMRSNFDHKMREIWSISEMTGDQIKQLGDAFIEVSLKSGISA